MTNKIILLLLLVMFSAFMVTGCGESDDNDDNNNTTVPTNPDDISFATADWFVSFISVGGFKANVTTSIMVYYLNPTNVPTAEDVVVLKVDNVDVNLQPLGWLPGLYTTSAMLNEGQSYNVELLFNGTSKVNTPLTMAYIPNATFPNSFSYNQSANVSWSLAGNNQYQFIGASSYGPGTDQDSNYSKQLTNTVRSYTIPANSVTNYGTATEYYLDLDQTNYKNINRVALMSFANDSQSYNVKGKEITLEDKFAKAMRLFKAINK
jgi:hypothetical protein